MKKTPNLIMLCFVLAALTLLPVISSTQAQADPTLSVTLIDRSTNAPIENATVQIYNSSSPYALIGQAVTPNNGTVTFSVKTGSYYIVLSNSEYNDTIEGPYTVTTNRSFTFNLQRVQYSGSVMTSAWTTQSSLNPGESGTLEISIYNENGSYPITLTNVSIHFPWYGFYENHWEGNVTISQGMPIEVQNKSSWTYSLSFTVPSDSRAYESRVSNGYVAFQAKAPAWKRVVVMTESGPQYALALSSTTVSINPLEPPGSTWYADFETVPAITFAYPMTNQSVSSALLLIEILLIVSIVCSVALAVLIFMLSQRMKRVP
jgi:hypothetical protein